MENARKERLQAGGIQVEEALARLMGNEALLERLLHKFLADPHFGQLCAALEAADAEAALEASHTLKGLCGNLSMLQLYGLFSRQVEALRSGDWDGAMELMPRIRAGYAAVVGAIEEA